MYDAVTTITRKEFQNAIEVGITAADWDPLDPEHVKALRQVGRKATSTRVGTFGFFGSGETRCPLVQAGIYSAEPDEEAPDGMVDFYSAFDRELVHCGGVGVVTITDTPIGRFIAWFRGLFKREG